MAVAHKDPVVVGGSPAEEILDAIRSEPAAALFLAQALWIAQPALEAFWPAEKIAALADLLETKTDPAPEAAAGPGRGESGGRK